MDFSETVIRAMYSKNCRRWNMTHSSMSLILLTNNNITMNWFITCFKKIFYFSAVKYIYHNYILYCNIRHFKVLIYCHEDLSASNRHLQQEHQWVRIGRSYWRYVFEDEKSSGHLESGGDKNYLTIRVNWSCY